MKRKISIIVLFLCLPSLANFTYEQEWSILENNQIIFNVVFNQVPDFYTTDSAGRQANAFQYYCYVNPPETPETTELVLLSGGYINQTNMIGVRDNYAAPRDWLTFSIEDETMQFVLPVSTSGDDDGHFQYMVVFYSYGRDGVFTPLHEVGTAFPVPAPAGVWLAGIGLLGVGFLKKTFLKG